MGPQSRLSYTEEHSMLPEAGKTGLDKLKAQGESHSNNQKKKVGNLHYFHYATNSPRVQVTPLL